MSEQYIFLISKSLTLHFWKNIQQICANLLFPNLYFSLYYKIGQKLGFSPKNINYLHIKIRYSKSYPNKVIHIDRVKLSTEISQVKKVIQNKVSDMYTLVDS